MVIITADAPVYYQYPPYLEEKQTGDVREFVHLLYSGFWF